MLIIDSYNSASILDDEVMKILEKFAVFSICFWLDGLQSSLMATTSESSPGWGLVNKLADEFLFKKKGAPTPAQPQVPAEVQPAAPAEAPPPVAAPAGAPAPASAPVSSTTTSEPPPPAAAPLSVAKPEQEARAAPAPVAHTVSAKRYLGQLFVDLPRKQPWAMVKSGSFAGYCVYPDILDMNGKPVRPVDEFQWTYFRNLTGLIQFEPAVTNPSAPARHSGANMDEAFLRWLKARGCHSEDGVRATVYKSTMMIDLDVVQPELKGTEIEAQLVQLSSMPGYILGVIRRVGDHTELRSMVGMCIDFEEIWRANGSPIPAYQIKDLVRKTVRGFLSLDPRSRRFVQITKSIDGVDPRHLMQVAVRERVCKDSGTLYKIRTLKDGWVVDAATLVEWIHPYKKP